MKLALIYSSSAGSIDHDTNRPGFDPKVLVFYPTGLGQAVCHSLSYYTLELGFALILDGYFKNSSSRFIYSNQMTGIVDAVFRNPAAVNMTQVNFELAAHAALQNLNVALAQIFAPPAPLVNPSGPSIILICQYGNALLNILNSSLENLRVGDAIWNSSIGSSYDPTYWVHVDDTKQIDYSYAGKMAPPPVPPPAIPFPKPNSFYIYGPNDEYHLETAIDQGRIHLLISHLSARSTPTGTPFLYSSSNTFLFQPVASVFPAQFSIFAFKNDNPAQQEWRKVAG